jgi:transposase-like protein
MYLRLWCPYCRKISEYEVNENSDEFSELKCLECGETFLFKFGKSEFAKKEEV